MEIDENDVGQKKQLEPRKSDLRRATIEMRAEKENARNHESNSIKGNESNPQPLKQLEPRISARRGMTKDTREELKNA
jgi:hypothetical protein